jgi:hypothetical protein
VEVDVHDVVLVAVSDATPVVLFPVHVGSTWCNESSRACIFVPLSITDNSTGTGERNLL